jgi:hypothetical protein
MVQALALILLFIAFSSTAQPLPPEVTIGESTGRFEFAKIPELVLVRGMPQVVQLGFYQLDPNNRWPAGDVERASGWLSKHPTQLVDEAGAAVVKNIVSYDERTSELSYAGLWSGDITVRIKKIGTNVQSEPFRIRVLTPTVVWGDNAAAVNTQKQWNARVCPVETTPFATCRQKFSGGISDVAPLVVFITSGSYAGQDWYISTRPFTYILGDPGTRPTLANDEISGGRKQMFHVANFNLRNTGIVHSGAISGVPSTIIVRSVYQCCETADNNGLQNPNTGTGDHLWSVYWHASESKGMGGVGNSTHAAYIEGRPKSVFDINNVRILGTRGSSGIKTTMNELNVRHSVLQVAQSIEDLKNGVCVHPGSSTGCLMHTPVDFPGFTTATIYGNKFIVWRGPTSGVPKGRSGILAGTLFVRNRSNSLGSDTPNYPSVSWNPPVSTQGVKLPPCYSWDGTAATFVADKFWQDVRKLPLNDPANPCTFKHFISFNHFEQLPGSLPVYMLRDDGTYPSKATSQFATTVNILRNHPNWAERSSSYLHGNTVTGFDASRLYQLDRNPNVKYIEPLAYWPRQGTNDFPRLIEVTGELPPWFKL